MVDIGDNGRYRKRPVEVDAKQIGRAGSSWDLARVSTWLDAFGQAHTVNLGPGTITIPTLEGDMTASPGDWIIRGVAGEFYPCKPDIFDATYEPVEVEQSGRTVTDPQ
jgi:hypothetical protein